MNINFWKIFSCSELKTKVCMVAQKKMREKFCFATYLKKYFQANYCLKLMKLGIMYAHLLVKPFLDDKFAYFKIEKVILTGDSHY